MLVMKYLAMKLSWQILIHLYVGGKHVEIMEMIQPNATNTPLTEAHSSISF